MIHKRISQAQSGRQRGCRCVGGENTLLQRQLIPAPTQTAAMMPWHLTSLILLEVREHVAWTVHIEFSLQVIENLNSKMPVILLRTGFGILHMNYDGVEKKPLVGQEGTKQVWRMALEFVWVDLIRSTRHSCSNSLKESSWKPGMMVQAVIPALMRLRQEDYGFEASLSCLANPCFGKKKLKKERKKNL